MLNAVSRSQICVGRLLAGSWRYCVGVCPRIPKCTIRAYFSSQAVIKHMPCSAEGFDAASAFFFFLTKWFTGSFIICITLP